MTTPLALPSTTGPGAAGSRQGRESGAGDAGVARVQRLSVVISSRLVHISVGVSARAQFGLQFLLFLPDRSVW